MLIGATSTLMVGVQADSVAAANAGASVASARFMSRDPSLRAAALRPHRVIRAQQFVEIKGAVEREVDRGAARQIDGLLERGAVDEIEQIDMRLLECRRIVLARDVKDHRQASVGDAVEIGGEGVEG